MSQHNIEVVRRGYEMLAGGDMESLAALLPEHLDPEFEYQSELAGEAFGGVEGMRDFLVEVRETFRDYTTEVEEIIDCGGHVVVVSRQRGRGAGSGLPIEWRINIVWTFDGEKLVRGRAFSSRVDALADAGLGD